MLRKLNENLYTYWHEDYTFENENDYQHWNLKKEEIFSFLKKMGREFLFSEIFNLLNFLEKSKVGETITLSFSVDYAIFCNL